MTASVAGSIKWTALSQVGRLSIQIGGIVVMSRLLSPAEFGAYSMAMIVVNLAAAIRDVGIGAAVIQRRVLSQSFLDTAFLSSLVMGVVLTAIVYLSSPVAGAHFQSDDVASAISLAAPLFVIGSFAVVQQGLLERQAAFRYLSFIEIAAALCGTAVGVLFAAHGAGALSLVAQSLATSLLIAIAVWWRSSWRPTFQWSRPEFRETWRFNASLAGSSLLSFFARNADVAIIGTVLGASALGVYTVAYRLMLLPVQQVIGVVNRALLPFMSRAAGSGGRLDKPYLNALTLAALVSFPVMGLAFALREVLVAAVLGPEWSEVTDVLAWLALAGICQALAGCGGAVLIATRRSGTMLRLAALSLIMLLLGITLGLHWGISGVAAGYCAANLCFATFSVSQIMRQLAISFGAILNRLWRIALCASAASVSAFFVLRMIDNESLSPVVSLVAATTVGVATLLMGLLVSCRTQLIELYEALAESAATDVSVVGEGLRVER